MRSRPIYRTLTTGNELPYYKQDHLYNVKLDKTVGWVER